jgi:diphosphomevalonate decarboxylase
MQWFAQAPSNIALIKYMGKSDAQKNLPINDSFSYTLNELQSSVSLESPGGARDIWEPLDLPGYKLFSLSTQAQERFLQHLAKLKANFNYKGTFVVRSCNNFPQGSGLASSASSFAALTICAVRALCELTHTPLLSTEEQAQLSRLGSGSSCRSFYSPWALWSGEEVRAIDLPYTSLLHQAILIDSKEKSMPSSEAHLLIRTSPQYDARHVQAQEHLKLLLDALQSQDWANAYHICWNEFHSMHALFTSCKTPFSYMTPRTKDVLRLLQDLWNRENDGPIVTMDAGPNIHLLYRPDQTQLMRQFTQDHLVGNYDVI